MNLLAFDTSTEFLSIALQADGQLRTYHARTGQLSSQVILPQIENLLTEAKISLQGLDGIAFGAGPGAFTGLRIACGVAQGLGFGANLPVVGINTLHAVAEASGADHVIVDLDARMGEVYHAALIKQNGIWIEQTATQVCKAEAAPLLGSGAGDLNDWIGVGTGWGVYEAALHARFAVLKILPDMTPSAEAILRLAAPQFAAGKAVAAKDARPIYIRNRVALTALEREQGMRL